MKRILLLLFLLPALGFTCDDIPKDASASPMWLKHLLKASSKKSRKTSVVTKKKELKSVKNKKAGH